MKLLFVLAIAALASAHYLDAPAMSQNMIDDINSRSDVHWTAGKNERFAGLTLREVSGLMGTLPTYDDDNMEVVDTVVADIPESFDSREAWPHCPSIRTVRDQSVCGSCWAFGAAEAWSDRVCIATKGEITDPMSTQDLLTCCGLTCGSGCNGGYLSGAWKYIKSNGLVTGGLYAENQYCSSYSLAPCDHHIDGSTNPCGDTVKTPKCVKACNGTSNRDWSKDKHFASKVYSVASKEAAIQTEIMTNGPIEAAFTVYADFMTYKSGVYHHVSGSHLGGHAIKIIGWGVEAGQKYWLIANSWNVSWGDKGYFKIKRGTNECGIENEGYAGTL